jgi:hypothetical protein
MAHVGRMMEQLRDTDPDAWAEYVAEGLAWEEGTAGLDA